MRNDIAIAVAAVAAVLGLVLVFTLWHRLSERVALAAAGVLGVMLGAGVLLLQDDPGFWDWLVALGLLAVGTPLHCSMVFGRPGRPA